MAAPNILGTLVIILADISEVIGPKGSLILDLILDLLILFVCHLILALTID